MSGVLVAGVGMHPFGRFEQMTTTDIGVVAVRQALEDAKIWRGGFQAAFCATAYGGVASGHKVLGRLGMTGMPIVDVEAGCASGGAALALASNAIRSGQIDTALVFGIEKMPRGDHPLVVLRTLARGFGTRFHTFLFRVSRSAPHAYFGRDEAASRGRRCQEPQARSQ